MIFTYISSILQGNANITECRGRRGGLSDGVIRRRSDSLFGADHLFPHEDAEDYRITYDACAEEVLYEAAGRRSGKRERMLLEKLREYADVLAAKLGGRIYWEQPLTEARRG